MKVNFKTAEKALEYLEDQATFIQENKYKYIYSFVTEVFNLMNKEKLKNTKTK